MHPLNKYISKQLSEKLKARKVVVWYDPRREFAPFVAELRGGARTTDEAVPVTVSDISARLTEYDGSMFELRTVVEPFVCADAPTECMIVYLPGCERDRQGSVLMELEKAGDCYEPQLKRLARNVLRQRYTDGVIDEMLAPEQVSYEDLARASSDSSSTEPPSVLRSIFHSASGNEGIIAAWLASDERDAEIEAKEAIRELVKLVRSKLGLELSEVAPLAKLRSITLRYVLGAEFRSVLVGVIPSSVQAIPAPKSRDEETSIKELAHVLRARYSEVYPQIADRVEAELGLHEEQATFAGLGSTDTFRFAERVLLAQCGELVAAKKFDEALEIIGGLEHSFWLERDVGRKAQWEACRLMAELGILGVAVHAAIGKASGDANTWISAYAAKDGWFRLDQAQRRLEAWVANLDDEPEERPLGVVRGIYEDACRAMAEGFTRALVAAKWTVSSSLHQTKIYSGIVSEQPKPVAYFFVDAMRFEMGVELAERLPQVVEVSVRPAVCVLPSITPIGMAALQPGASSSFSVVEQAGALGVRIDDAFLPDLAARKKFASSRIPKLADVALDELLSLQPSRLVKRIDGAQVVIVRSQEIDHAGERGFTFQARQVMDTVIDNLARAVRKLATAGIENCVLTADHGHLFFPSDRDESMRLDPPGGDEVDLHRRCWIGRGGATPTGCVRVTASALGYDSDLDFVFPASNAVFKAGGDLAFHHGGPSLQEMVIPVVTVRMKTSAPKRSTSEPVTATGLPDAVTNRIFSVVIQLDGKNLSLFSTELLVRPMLISAGKQVGGVGMAIDGDFDRTTGCVKLQAGKQVTVAFLLSDESVPSLRIVIQDPTTDAELYRSPIDIPVRLGV
ncbi:PglZ domain-containing protein [Bradyrhizobium sp. CB1717]|uniref:PglZ domain-containing protein n=1 Tax=Bradyrhizobium sp. CB1717 TaxID=3039154 RepID=UPI0024B27369|nr:PglZ domain-containing protein [Bradyrhizobium sp. CB1717]WFU25116.1 PglZ domain-containing protein [Bradyrhizobium sp. CB1717]